MKSKLLVVVVVLQTALIAKLWVMGGGSTSSANAQVPDGGNQRLQMLDELKATNERLDKLLNVLQSGNVQVRVAKPDESKAE